MKKFLPLSALIGLILTACHTVYPTVPVPMTDPNVLSGHWTGQVTQQHSIEALGQDAEHLFVLDSGAVAVYDLKSGQLQRSVAVPSGIVRYRQDGVIVVMTDTGLLTYDALTLKLLATRTLPTSTRKNWQLSLDGSVLFNANSSSVPQERWLTTSLKALPTASVPGTEYYDSILNSDQRWWSVYSKTQINRTYRVIRADTGNGFTVAVKAPNCSNTLSALTSFPVPLAPAVTAVPTTNDPEHSADQDLLVISQPDGTVEVWNAAGTVLRTLRVSAACETVSVAPTNRPGVAAFRVGMERGTINLNTGEVLRRATFTATDTVFNSFIGLSDGVLTIQTPPQPTGLTSPENNYWSLVNVPTFGFRPWEGQAWTIANAVHTLSLSVQATKVDDEKATVTGSLTVNDHTLQVSGTLSTMQAKLTSQALPFMPGLYADLIAKDGNQQVGRLFLKNDFKVVNTKPVSADLTPTPVYVATWQQADNMNWVGLLKRP